LNILFLLRLENWLWINFFFFSASLWICIFLVFLKA
jgi:hypothetical protein